MGHSYHHAISSANKFGGKAEDYAAIHNFIDSSKAHVADARHRAILHSSFGVFIVEQVFGIKITNSDNKMVMVRQVAEQHIVEDLGFIPTLSDYLENMPLEEWMYKGAEKLSRDLFTGVKKPVRETAETLRHQRQNKLDVAAYEEFLRISSLVDRVHDDCMVVGVDMARREGQSGVIEMTHSDPDEARVRGEYAEMYGSNPDNYIDVFSEAAKQKIIEAVDHLGEDFPNENRQRCLGVLVDAISEELSQNRPAKTPSGTWSFLPHKLETAGKIKEVTAQEVGQILKDQHQKPKAGKFLDFIMERWPTAIKVSIWGKNEYDDEGGYNRRPRELEIKDKYNPDGKTFMLLGSENEQIYDKILDMTDDLLDLLGEDFGAIDVRELERIAAFDLPQFFIST